MQQIKFISTLLITFLLFACSSSKQTDVKKIDYQYTANNVKYLDLKVGKGESPQIGNRVTINAKVMTEDGTVLEDTFSSGKPLSFVLYNVDDEKLEVIPGLAEGVMTMKIGGIRKLWIPPKMGFGSRSQRKIDANSTIVIEVELLDIK